MLSRLLISLNNKRPLEDDRRFYINGFVCEDAGIEPSLGKRCNQDHRASPRCGLYAFFLLLLLTDLEMRGALTRAASAQFDQEKM